MSSLDPESVRVWREGWWRPDAGSWTQVETAPSSAQWSAPGPEIAAQLREYSSRALTLSADQPIAFVMADRGIGPSAVYLLSREWGMPYARKLVGDAGAAALLRLPRPPLSVVLRPHPQGSRGLAESIERVKGAIARGRNNPFVVTWTRQVLHAAGVDGPRGNPNPDAIVATVFAAQKREVSFFKDPVNGELMAAPEQLLCLDPNGACMPAGDCDDQLILAGSAVASVGIPVRLVIKIYVGQAFGHITLEYDSGPRLGGPWKCLDPSTDSGVCSSLPYKEKTIVNLVDPQDQTFMGLGDPAGAGALGQPPPGAIELPADQAAGWIAQLERTQSFLSRSVARLRANSDALSAVRTDLGLPAVDSPPAGEALAGASPLDAYVRTGAWTAEAQAAESKVLQTADFISGCIADGLAGTRVLVFNPTTADLEIEQKPGDPYAVRLAPGPNGGMVPTFFDAQGQAVSTLGILPIVIAAVVAACTLAVAYVVGKICDQLATTHHDDALNKIATQQSALVASGAQTPAQSAAMVAALTDLDKANPTPPSTLQKFLDTFPVVGVLGAAAAGLAAGFGLSRLAGSLGWGGAGRATASEPRTSEVTIRRVGSQYEVRKAGRLIGITRTRSGAIEIAELADEGVFHSAA